MPIIYNPANTLRDILPGPGNNIGVDGGMFSGVPETQQSFQQCLAVTLTSAQITTMFTTPVTLLRAPGADVGYIIDYIVFKYNFGGTAYTSGGVVSIQYNGGAAVANTIPAATVTAGASSSTVVVTGASNIVVTQNAALTITNATGAFATGNGTAQVLLWYSIV